MTKNAALAAALVAGLTVAACSAPAEETPPVATPRVTLSRAEAPIGSPIDITYAFDVAPTAPAFAEDYIVFVHFINADGELMWTDDHQPPTPTRQWKPNQTIEYQRTVFVPKFPYTGETRIHVGLYSPASNVRLPLAGEGDGGRAYRVGLFQMTIQTDNLFVVYKDGWHQPEVADDGQVEWQWSGREGTVSFRNPKRDVTVMLDADMPVAALNGPQQVDVRLGPAVVDTFELGPKQRQLRRIPLTAGQLGDGETVEMTIAVGRTFVPAAVPALKNNDARELGVRVFRVYVEPK
jgi:hypothetical protein